MQPRIRSGLIVGVIGLVINACVAGFVGLCGPAVSMVAGGLAGYLAVQGEKPPHKGDGARVGAVAGGVAGALIIIGQVLGGIGALMFFQFSGTQVPFGTVPSPSSDPSMQVGYYLGGVGTGICFGLLGALLAAGVGAAIGYLATPDHPADSLSIQ